MLKTGVVVNPLAGSSGEEEQLLCALRANRWFLRTEAGKVVPVLSVSGGNVGRGDGGAVIEGFPNELIVAAITEHIKGRMDKMRDGRGEMKGR